VCQTRDLAQFTEHLRKSVFVATNDRNTRACARKLEGGRAANALRRAANNGGLPFE
jgi:hypothetical protein